MSYKIYHNIYEFTICFEQVKNEEYQELDVAVEAAERIKDQLWQSLLNAGFKDLKTLKMPVSNTPDSFLSKYKNSNVRAIVPRVICVGESITIYPAYYYGFCTVDIIVKTKKKEEARFIADRETKNIIGRMEENCPEIVIKSNSFKYLESESEEENIKEFVKRKSWCEQPRGLPCALTGLIAYTPSKKYETQDAFKTDLSEYLDEIESVILSAIESCNPYVADLCLYDHDEDRLDEFLAEYNHSLEVADGVYKIYFEVNAPITIFFHADSPEDLEARTSATLSLIPSYVHRVAPWIDLSEAHFAYCDYEDDDETFEYEVLPFCK